MLTISSGSLLSAAKRAVDRNGSIADDALIATLFSAFAFEAWLNEVIDRLRHAREEELFPPLDLLHHLIAAADLDGRSTSLWTRIQVFGTVLGGPTWSRGVQPYQDFGLLIEIRNWLVHLRPERTAVDIYEDSDGNLGVRQDKLGTIAERLVKAKVIARPDPRTVTPIMVLLQRPEVGRWAYMTVVATINAVTDLLPGGWRVQAVADLADLLAAPSE